MPDAGAPVVDPLAPKVSILEPQAASDPDADDVVTDAKLRVLCQVDRSALSDALAVDKSSVSIVLTPPGDGAKPITGAVNALSGNEFDAMFDLDTLPNGRLQIVCSAKDVSKPPRMGSATSATFLDLGPKITVEEPTAKPYALKTAMPIKFTVEGAPLGEDDDEQAIDEVTLTVAGVQLPVKETEGTPGLYQTSVDFDDRVLFPVPPTSAQVIITATNKRTPNAATRTKKVDVTIDGAGPTISIVQPGDGQIVRGNVVLEVDVSDPSGVRPSSLIADINNGLYTVTEWIGAGRYRQSFDTRRFPLTLSQLTVEVSATDLVGNQSTVTRSLKLDNVPPVISLDPPLIREWRQENDVMYCSERFDPVGDDTPNDLEVIGTRRYRVLVEDETNTPLATPNDPDPVPYVSDTDPTSVTLFMQTDTSVPLLIDTDKDGYCDEINFDTAPAGKQPVKLPLSPVFATGTPWYPRISTEDPDIATSCYKPDAALPFVNSPVPNNACVRSEMRRVVQGRIVSKPPAVYAKRPTNNAETECTGEVWELINVAREGWICLAARALDKVGNIGVSAPLRACYDDPSPDKPSQPACAASCTYVSGTTANNPTDCAAQAPSCTDGCKMSASQLFHYTQGKQTWNFQ